MNNELNRELDTDCGQTIDSLLIDANKIHYNAIELRQLFKKTISNLTGVEVIECVDCFRFFRNTALNEEHQCKECGQIVNDKEDIKIK